MPKTAELMEKPNSHGYIPKICQTLTAYVLEACEYPWIDRQNQYN